MTIRVAALYRFARFDDPSALRVPLLDACRTGDIKGTLLLAPEGINGTIAGSAEGVDAVLTYIRTLPGCADLELKFSTAGKMLFHRMKVRLKREIVTMGVPDLDPADAGTYVAPSEWNALIDMPGTLLIDTRNDYEVKVGTFAGAVDPHTASFRDFPAWAEEHHAEIEAAPRVAMFCTGGIRCEKATALLKARGVEDVYHLEGGILKYLAQVSKAESRWQGECFVFDERVAVRHGLEAGTHTLCRGCRMPVSPEDRASPLYEEGVSCPACRSTRDNATRAGYAERHRQVLLAEARGEVHVGTAKPANLIRLMTEKSIQLHHVTSWDVRIVPLVRDAGEHGHRFMRRLQGEWDSGANRFQGPGERFFAATMGDRIVAVGGLNKDPYVSTENVGRLRHVYVSSAARRLGIGTFLVRHIIDHAARTFAILRLRTTTAEAAAFYEQLGFQTTDEEDATHVFRILGS